LVIDDDPSVTHTFRLFLESAGFEVDTFNDPIDVIRTFSAENYDLLLIDVRMPKINGFKLFQELKKIDFKIKACFVTGFESYYVSLQEQFSLDVNCFIKKPISKEELIEHVLKRLTN
jgi:two-component system catabolic regulation response regulator CreB/two-component system response regulator ChvI